MLKCFSYTCWPILECKFLPPSKACDVIKAKRETQDR